MSRKIIVSTAALYNYLNKVLVFNEPEMEVRIQNGELQIFGLDSLMVEHTGVHTEVFETEVSADKLIRLRSVLSTVTDQPITLRIDYDEFTIQHIMI